MLDKYIVPVIKPKLRQIARSVSRLGLSADQVTVFGFCLGMLAIPAVFMGWFAAALMLLLLNRIADGIDGELARINQPTDAGGFLDITLDFVFYAAFPLGFALHDPAVNALPAALLIASFVGTGSSFLAFSSLAASHEIEHPDFAYKSLYYLDGLAEGTETIICFALMCLFPQYFPIFAYFFAVICAATALNRIYFGYTSIRKR